MTRPRQLERILSTASPQVHSCLPLSAHPSGTTVLRVFAIVGQQHQFYQQSSAVQRDAHSHEPQEDASLFFPSVAPAYPRLLDFYGSRACAPWCLSSQTLMTGKVTCPLELRQHFMMPMREDGEIFLAHQTVKVAGTDDGVRCSCHKEPAN